jgi:hypothetical protein
MNVNKIYVIFVSGMIVSIAIIISEVYYDTISLIGLNNRDCTRIILDIHTARRQLVLLFLNLHKMEKVNNKRK